MKGELFRILTTINIKDLNETDKEELLRFFNATKNCLIRDRIALILSEAQYNKAVPDIIKKISDKKLFNKNGTLVFALGDLNTKRHFSKLIDIICTQDYEARLMAYGIIEDSIQEVSANTIKKALKILNSVFERLEMELLDESENSQLHFVQQTIKLLNEALI